MGCGAPAVPAPPWDTTAGLAGHYAGRVIFRYTGVSGTTYGSSSGTPYVGTYTNDQAGDATVEKGTSDDAVFFIQSCAVPLDRTGEALTLSGEKVCNAEVTEANSWSGTTSATNAWSSHTWTSFTVDRTSAGIRASGQGTHVNRRTRDGYTTAEWTSPFTYEFEGSRVSTD
jgi:hypothetical protein